MTTLTKKLGIGFLSAWIIGAVLVDTINLPTPIYAILVVGLEIAFFVSLFVDLAHKAENIY